MEACNTFCEIRAKHFSLNRFLSYIIVAVNLTPYLIRNCPRIIQIFLCIGWFLSAFLEFKIPFKSKRNNTILLLIILFEFIELFYFFVGVSTANIGNYLMNCLSLLSILIAISSFERNSAIHNSRLFVFSVFVVIVNVLSNIYQSFVSPNAFVDINYTWGTSYLGTNVAQTWFYAVVFLCAGFILAGTKKGNRFKAILLMIPLIYFLFFVSPRATSCIMFVLMILFFVVCSNKTLSKNLVVSLLLTLVLSILLILSFSMVFPIVSKYFSGSRLFDRAQDIYSFVSSGETGDGSFSERLSFIGISLKSFASSIRSFIFGSGYHVGEPIVTGIGAHSTFIDMLPKYGLIGFTLFALLIILSLSSLFKSYKNGKSKIYAIIISTLFIIYGFLNNSLNPGIFTIFFVCGFSFVGFEKNRLHKHRRSYI